MSVEIGTEATQFLRLGISSFKFLCSADATLHLSSNTFLSLTKVTI
jgi:hypothetical protein